MFMVTQSQESSQVVCDIYMYVDFIYRERHYIDIYRYRHLFMVTQSQESSQVGWTLKP